MQSLSALFKALSDRNRLRVVWALMQYEELCACQLIELLQISGATASRHMGVLMQNGLVCSRKDGRWVYYHLCRESAKIAPLLAWLEAQLTTDPEAQLDAKRLKDITDCPPEVLCKRQRTPV